METKEIFMLKEAFASPPGRPGKFVFAIRRVGQQEPFAIQVFAAKYAVKKYLEILVGNDEVVFEGPQYLRTSSGLVVTNWNCERTYTLQSVWEYEYTLEEMAWKMPEPHYSDALRIRRGKMTETESPTQHKPKRESTPRASRDGLVSIGEIAAQLQKEPRELRKILRDKKIAKPAAGWAWPKDEVEKIKELLK